MNGIRFAAIIALVQMFIFSCRNEEKIARGEGLIEVNGGKIWYRVQGDGNRTPILMLHGGPGHPSHYLNPLAALRSEWPVITFDQLGCGRSDRISDTSLMTVANYSSHINELVNHLKLEEFYLYGHSWGTMLGVDYYLKYGDKVKALILASPCIDAERWVKDADVLISTLPDSVQRTLRNNMKGIQQDSTKLQAAVNTYLNNFYTRRHPISADLDSANSNMGYNVYQYMWGDYEFFASGTLKNYDRTGELNQIKVPTLYTVGEFDESQPATVKYYQSLTPNSKLRLIPDAGHMTMHDNPDENVKVISEFLNEIER